MPQIKQLKIFSGPALARALFPLLLLALAAAFFPGQQEALAASKGNVKTKVTSDVMNYDSGKKTVTFSKNVKVVHPDFTLTSENLVLYLTDGKSGGSGAAGMEAGQIERIVANGSVNIRLPEGRSAACGKATYTVRNEKLVMEQKPILREDSNSISGEVINFYFAENRSEVKGKVNVEINTRERDTPIPGKGR